MATGKSSVCIDSEEFKVHLAKVADLARAQADGTYKDLAAANKAWTLYKALSAYCPPCEPPNPPPQPPPAS